MSDLKIDPFKFIGKPEEWAPFGDGQHDEQCDAERRAICHYFIRRIEKGAKRQPHGDSVADVLTGGFVGFAGLFISSGGGPEAMTEETFERFIGAATFAWYQAMSAGSHGSAVQ